MTIPSFSYKCSKPLAIIVLLLATGHLFAAGINTGLLVCRANQDAELQLEDVPRNMTEPADTVTIRWVPEVPGILRYSANFAGNDPQNYNHIVEEPFDRDDGMLQVLGEQLPVGRLFCIIVEDIEDEDERRHSTVFNILRVPGNAPEMIAPISGAGREGINTVTPTFRWEAVAGVPYYHIIMSDQAFVIIEDENTGEIRVEGANIIWQVITPRTSIQYGVPDPSEYFDNDHTPPLVGNNAEHRDDRPRYSWVVLNNFGNHPGYTSTVVGGVAGFEVEVDPPFGEPENIAPEDGVRLADEEILFRWTGVREAASYFIYVAREEISPGGSRAFIPAWSSQTTLTSITCPAADMLSEGRYVWKILAADRQGRGTLSDTTSFSYSIASGFVAFRTFDVNEDPLEFVEISAEPIHGAGIPDFSTNDVGYYDRLIPVGTYIFHAVKDGYEEAVSDELTIEEDERYTVEFTLELVPSSILGRVVDDDGAGVAGATVTAHPIDGGDDARMETNISGEYQIVAMPGRWAVSATARGHSPSDTLVIEVPQGENIDLEDRLTVEAYRFTVSGYVRNGDGQPINLATVTLTGEDDQEHRAFTPESGRYSFAVGTGVWTLSANKAGFYLEEGPTRLEIMDRDIEVNLTLLPQAGIISGRVLIDGNQANRQVDVWMIPSAGDIVVSQTNQRGTFSQGVLPGDYRVFPVLQGYNAADTLNLSVGPGETLSGLELELEATEVYITGTVDDDDDEALQNAEVSSGGLNTRTDQSGNYRLGVFPGTHTVTAQKFGYVTEELGPFEVEAGNDLEDVNFELSDNAGTISGQVRRGNDRIFDATVTAIRGEQISITHTDRDGEYSFGLVFGNYLVTARCEGFIADEPDTLEVRLQPGQEISGRDFIMLRYIGRITGTVRTSGGEPIRSPSVRVVELEEPDNGYNGVGNVEGRFSVGVPPERRYIVTITQEGYAEFRDTTDVLEIDGEFGFGVITLASLPCRISGVVTAVDEPLGNVNIRVVSEEETYTGQTDRNGGYRFDLEAGSYHITASKPGYTVGETDIRLGPGQERDDLNFILEENFAMLTGGTYDPDEEPIADVMIYLIDNATDHVVFLRRTDEDGMFGFDRVIPGNYRLEAEHQRYEDGSLNIGAIIAGQRRQGLNMTLTPMDGMIRGTVTADDDAPVGGATVFVTAEDDSRVTAQTNDQGQYTVLNIPDGIYNVHPAKVGFTGDPIDGEDVELEPGDTLDVDLRMIRHTGRITGSVRDPDEVGLRGARVSAFNDLGHFTAVESDRAGRYIIENLYPNADYTMTVTLADYTPERDTLTDVEVNDEIDFVMTPNSLRLSGRTVNQAGTIIPQIRIEAEEIRTGSNIRATSDDNGDYELSGLAPNSRYQIQTLSLNEDLTNADIDIETGLNHITGVDLELIDRSASISGNAQEIGVNIVAQYQDDQTTVSAITGQNGDYQMSRLLDGEWTVTASKTGYRISPNERIVTVDIGEDANDVDFSVERILLTISGIVRDSTGEPAADVPILAWSEDGESRDTADNSGAFEIDSLAPHRTYQMATEMPEAGYDNDAVHVELEEESVDDVDLTINRHNATIVGTVRNAEGELYNGAIVTLDELHRTDTDQEGSFRFEYLAGGEHSITVSAHQHLPYETTVNTQNGEGEYNVQIAMERPQRAIFGWVTEWRGPRLSHCLVTATDDLDEVLYDTTDAGGQYSFNDLDLNRTYVIRVEKKGYEPTWTNRISVAEESREWNFYLHIRSNHLLGQFLGREGNRIANAPVVLQSFANTIAYDTTDHAGEFVFPVETGNYMLMATDPDDESLSSFNRNLVIEGGETVRDTLRLQDAGIIEGRLQTEDGDPPGSSGYIVSHHSATGDLVFNWSRADGSFRLRGLRPGTHIISVEASGYAPVDDRIEVEVSPRETSSIVVVLTQDGKAINGYVTDQDSDPVVRARITITGPSPANLVTTDEGYYTLSDPDAGQYNIHSERIGYASVDSTFELLAGEIAQVNLTMERSANTISGRLTSNEGDIMDDITVHLIQNNEVIDSTRSDPFGEYQFSDLDAGIYKLELPTEDYVVQPEEITVDLSDGESVLNQDFVLMIARGIGVVSGLVIHQSEPVPDVTITLSNLDTGRRLTAVSSDVDSIGIGSFEFLDVEAPGTYRLTASSQQFSTRGESFTLGIDSTVVDTLVFPAGKIIVRVQDVDGNPILGHHIQVNGVDVSFYTSLYTDRDGYAETIDWLLPGSYNIVPAGRTGSLPPQPRLVELALDEEVESFWSIGWTVDLPEPVDVGDTARVEILVPGDVDIEQAKLYWKPVGALAYEEDDLQRDDGEGLFSSDRTARSTRYPQHIERMAGSDQNALYYGIIPPQTRSGAVRYYLEVRTVEGFVYGGPETAQDLMVTANNLLDQVELTRLQSGSDPQLEFPIRLQAAVFDEAGHDLLALELPPTLSLNLDWEEVIGNEFGELTVWEDDPSQSEYLPHNEGDVEVKIKVVQDFDNDDPMDDITVTKTIRWVNRRYILNRLRIDAPVTSIASGDTIKFSATATDNSGRLMSIVPLWKIEPEILGEIAPIPLTSEALFYSQPNRIGQLSTVSVKDSLTEGISARFNAETRNESKQGLVIYGLIDGGTEATFDDGADFRVFVPSGSVDQNHEAFLHLARPELPLVVRLTSDLEALPVGYRLHIEGSPPMPNLDYQLSFPIPEGVPLNNPQIGRWDPVLLNWTRLGGQMSDDGAKIDVTVDHLEGTYAIVSSAEPLGIRDLRLHPNPFSPHNGGQLVIDFRLSSDQSSRPNLSIKIYNMAGQLVKTLIRSKDLAKSVSQRETWDGTTDDGRMARNGRYVVVMIVKDSSDEVKEIRTVVLVK